MHQFQEQRGVMLVTSHPILTTITPWGRCSRRYGCPWCPTMHDLNSMKARDRNSKWISIIILWKYNSILLYVYIKLMAMLLQITQINLKSLTQNIQWITLYISSNIYHQAVLLKYLTNNTFLYGYLKFIQKMPCYPQNTKQQYSWEELIRMYP